MATPKQEKFIKLVLENLGVSGSTRSLGELMREAGYSESMCKNPQMVFESETVQDGIKDFVNQLDDKRKRAITHITESKLEKSTAKDLASIVDILTKDHQLLTGGDTERSKTIVMDSSLIGRYGSNNTTPGTETDS